MIKLEERLYSAVADLLEGDANSGSDHLKEFWEECSKKEVARGEELLRELAAELRGRGNTFSAEATVLPTSEPVLDLHKPAFCKCGAMSLPCHMWDAGWTLQDSRDMHRFHSLTVCEAS